VPPGSAARVRKPAISETKAKISRGASSQRHGRFSTVGEVGAAAVLTPSMKAV
jgi:hypothetical protein